MQENTLIMLPTGQLFISRITKGTKASSNDTSKRVGLRTENGSK